MNFLSFFTCFVRKYFYKFVTKVEPKSIKYKLKLLIMNQLQERKRSMYYVVEDFLATVPAATLATLPEFDTKLTTFTNTVALIRAQSESQSTNRVGYRMVKNDLKLVMTRNAIDVATRIRAYAINIAYTVLREEMNQRMSNLYRRPDTVCADISQYIHSKGTELLTNLATYGVTADMLIILSKSINDYIAYIPKPRAGIVAQKQATNEMRMLFTNSDTVLKSMDALITMLQFSDPDLYSLYFSSRKTIRPGYRTLSLQGNVTDVEGLPIEKATVIIETTGLTRKTTVNGGFEVKDLASGMYAVVVSKLGYRDTRTIVAVTATERTMFNAVLEPDIRTTEKVA